MKEKKPFYKRPWFIVLAVLIVFGVATSGQKSDSSSDNQTASNNTESQEGNNNSTVEETSTENIYRIGETVVVGDVEYIVNSVSTAKSVGSQYLSAEAKGTFLLINLTIKNNGNDSLTVDNSLFKLINGDKEFESDSTAGFYANDDIGFFLEKINPDLSLTGNVVFDVSDETISAEELQLRVQTGFWGTQKGYIYLNK